MRLRENVCKVDASAKTIMLKAKYQNNNAEDEYLTDDYVLKITYTSLANNIGELVISLL